MRVKYEVDQLCWHSSMARRSWFLLLYFGCANVFRKKSHAQVVLIGFVAILIVLTIVRPVTAKDTWGWGSGGTIDEAVRDVWDAASKKHLFVLRGQEISTSKIKWSRNMRTQQCILAHVARCVIINQDFIRRGGHRTVEFRYEYLRFCCKENEIFRRGLEEFVSNEQINHPRVSRHVHRPFQSHIQCERRVVSHSFWSTLRQWDRRDTTLNQSDFFEIRGVLLDLHTWYCH